MKKILFWKWITGYPKNMWVGPRYDVWNFSELDWLKNTPRKAQKTNFATFFGVFVNFLSKKIATYAFNHFFFSITASYLAWVVKRHLPVNKLEEKTVKICRKMSFRYYETTFIVRKSSFLHFILFCLSLSHYLSPFVFIICTFSVLPLWLALSF